MGYSRWNASDWNSYSTSTKTKTTDKIFSSRGMHKDLNPYGVAMRESKDSTLNPQSNAIIVGLDVTGSMGMLADILAKEGLGVLVEEILIESLYQILTLWQWELVMRLMIQHLCKLLNLKLILQWQNN